MAKQTKYFLADTDEEVLLGDVISQTLVKDFKDGRKLSRKIEFELTEETLPHALEIGIIEEGEDSEEDNNDLLDFNEELDETIDALIETQEDHDKRIEILEDQVKVLKTLIDGLTKKSPRTCSKQPKTENNE